MNFLSCTPFIYKINTIKALIFCTYSLNSNFGVLHRELKFLINYFQENNFPIHLVHNQIRSFLNKIYEPVPQPLIVPRKCIYVKLPYFGYISEKIKQEILKILEKYFPHLDLKICFVNSLQIGSFFNHKDRLATGMCSSIVYLFKRTE